MPSLPLAASDLARDLDLSYRTALRICEKKRPLKPSELVYLQVIHFGLIPDKDFIRGKWFVREGVLMSHAHKIQIDICDANAYVVMRNNYYILLGDLQRANERVRELEARLGVSQSNVVYLGDYKK